MKHYLTLALALCLLVGCGAEPTPTPDLVATQIAVEKAAHATMTAEAPTPTQTPTDTPTPTVTEPPSPAATSTPLPPLSTPTLPPAPTSPPTTRIQFQPGATSGIVRGDLEQHSSHTYVLGASGGQTMEITTISTTPVNLAIWGEDGAVLKSGHDDSPDWQGNLPSTQDYFLRISSGVDQASYDMRVTIFARIQFDPGASSTMLSGVLERVGPGGVEFAGGYVLRASAGQTMEVVVTSPSSDVLLSIVGEDGVPLKRYVDGETQWQGVLHATQDYFLHLVSAGGDTSFTLQFTIPPP